MKKISEDVKLYILRELAKYRSASDVAEDVRVNLGIDVNNSQVAYYDPKFSRISESHKAYFEECRREFLQSSKDIPGANQSVRVQWMWDALTYLKRQTKRNIVLEMAVLEQISKEEGGMYINTKLGIPLPNEIPEGDGKTALLTTARLLRSRLITVQKFTPEKADAFVQQKYNISPAELMLVETNGNGMVH